MKVTSLRYLDAKFHHPSPKIKKIPKNTNGRLAIPALAGLLLFLVNYNLFSRSQESTKKLNKLIVTHYSLVSTLINDKVIIQWIT